MNQISVMSYNIWFDETERENRLLSLIDIIKHRKPDIICLQEVIPKIAIILIEKLKDLYNHTYPQKIDQQYGCMIFSRYPIINCFKHDYIKTNMGRRLYYIVIEYNMIIDDDIYLGNQYVVKQNLVIATSHFESEFKKNNDIKTGQYQQARQILNELYNVYGPVICCSDTNILPHEERYFITEDRCWHDAWKTNGEDKSIEYTYDTACNLNLKNRNIQKEIRSRIDRIIYRGNSVLIPLDFKLIKSRTDMIEASDHFGIMAYFKIIDSRVTI